MDELGDYLYLIVFAIAGLSSFLKKRKKTQTADEEQEERPSVFEQMTEEEEDWWNSSKEQPTSQTIIVTEPVKVPPIYETRDNLMGYESTGKYEAIKVRKQNISSVQKIDVQDDSEMDEDDLNVMHLNLNDVDEAKRAFVYSEIFSRKY